MKKRSVWIALLSIALLSRMSAQEEPAVPESPDIEIGSYRQATGLETWQHKFDISAYPEGKYNIIVRGTDLAGNEFLEGPFNILIDPASDKPVVRISSPEPDMHVGGNLNIVGTCTDDDAVARVEIRIDDGAFMAAGGTDFWSYYLDTDNMEDGEYRITVRGTDKNGTVGDPQSVGFVLDTSTPVNRITSFENGALLHGRVNIEGTVFDLNGIGKLELSRDGGETFEQISIKKKKNEPEATFSIKVDTRDVEDGPQIYWLRSTDSTGSRGASPFLFFVDNKAPVLDVLFPTKDFQVNGKFRVIGRVQDDVGIDTLTFRYGKNDPVEIPLATGDPYWFHDFDFSGEAETDILFSLTDRTGNSTDHRLRLKLDKNADLPQFRLVSPVPDSSDGAETLAGFVSDDDGVAEIVYSLDGGSPVSVPASYSFNESLGSLSAGPHKLEVRAVDVNGIVGESEKISFTKQFGPPSVRFDSALPAEGDGADPLSGGMTIDISRYKALTGSIIFGNEPLKATFRINGGESRTLSLKKSGNDGEMLFTIPLKELPAGFTEFSVEASDKAGFTAGDSFYCLVNGAEPAAADNKLYFTDRRFDPEQRSGGPVLLREGEEIRFLFNGEAAGDAQLVNGGNFLEVVTEGNLLILKAVSSGYSRDCEIQLTASGGRSFTVGPFAVVVDGVPPDIILDSNMDGILVTDGIDLNGMVEDNLSVSSFGYSINGGAFNDIVTAEGAFSVRIPLQGNPDGDIILDLHAADMAGNNTALRYLLVKDTVGPVLEQIAPLKELAANGKVSFIGSAEDTVGIGSIEYTVDGEEFLPLKDPVFSVDLTLQDQDEVKSDFLLRVTDRAGNISTLSPSILTDSESDQPRVEIQIPRDGELVQDDFVISGMAFDDDEVSSISYRIDGGEFRELPGANSFEIPLRLEDLADNGHIVEVKAADPGGVESGIAQLSFNVSRSEPVSFLSQPPIDTTVRGVVTVSGESSDANGIRSVLISYDNGNTFNRTELVGVEMEDGSAGWRYSLDTAYLQDGPHSLLVKAVDRNGVEGLYTSLINVDNSAPEIFLTRIHDGLKTGDQLELRGRVTDNIQLESLKLELQMLSGDGEIVSLDLPAEDVLLQSIDLSALPTGWINMRLIALDSAGNRTLVSRNIERIGSSGFNRAVIFSPAGGEILSGPVTVQGRVESLVPIANAVLSVDGFPLTRLQLDDAGYYQVPIEDELPDGVHRLAVEVELEDGGVIRSEEIEISYSVLGPWVRIDNFSAGDFASGRPWLTGSTGYNYEIPSLSEKELKAFNKTMAVDYVEVSLDNGRTFSNAKGTEEWKFRLETQEYPQGELGILVRARFLDGTAAVAKTQLIVDETPPRVELLSPGEGMRFNESISVSGTGSDAFGLQSVEVALREGDKNRYQVPSFIQGLYIDSHVLGATYAEFGAGLTFFDDNVKLQVVAGLAPPGRFNGTVVGVKLLANIAVIPYEYFFGYDWSPFSSSLAVGAAFNYFTMTEDEDAQGLVLGALIGQIELIKVKIPEWKLFSAFSLYTEGQLWFISSDVSGGIEGRIAFGIRSNIF